MTATRTPTSPFTNLGGNDGDSTDHSGSPVPTAGAGTTTLVGTRDDEESNHDSVESAYTSSCAATSERPPRVQDSSQAPVHTVRGRLCRYSTPMSGQPVLPEP